MPKPPKKRQTVQVRPRSVPFPRPLIHASILGSLFLISFVCLITSVGIYISTQTRPSAFLVISTLVATLFLWMISLFKRRTARCPLCHGTPYLDTAAHKHVKATKLPILNFGMSNLLRTIFTQTFRCMFCGQLYDFLKKTTNPPAGEKKR